MLKKLYILNFEKIPVLGLRVATSKKFTLPNFEQIPVLGRGERFVHPLKTAKPTVYAAPSQQVANSTKSRP